MLMDRISPKMNIALKKLLYMHPKTPKIKKKKRFSTRDLEILKENSAFVTVIKSTLNLNIENIENIDQLAIGIDNSFIDKLLTLNSKENSKSRIL